MEEGLDLPTLISNVESIHRDASGHLLEQSLTPRSRILLKNVASELRAEILRQKYPKRTTTPNPTWSSTPKCETDEAFLHISLPKVLNTFEIIQQAKKAATAAAKDRRISKSNLADTEPAVAGDSLLELTVFHAVLVLLLTDGNCWHRLLAVEVLCMPKIQEFASDLGTDVASSFAECMKDAFIPVRRYAIEGLRSLGQNAAAQSTTLRYVALKDDDRRLRTEAVRALRFLGEQAVGDLVKCLEESDFWPVRCEAAIALGAMEEWSTPEMGFDDLDRVRKIRKALQAALQDRMPGVREAAAKALGLMGSHALKSVKDLMKVVRDNDLRVRIAVIGALGKVMSQAAPNETELGYRTLMEKGDLFGNQVAFPDMLRLVCRALTGTLRDREQCLKLAELADALNNRRTDRFHTPNHSARQLELLERSQEKLYMQRNYVREFFRAAEVAFAEIGSYAWPNMVARLIEEDERELGFVNRMSILRGLHCAGAAFASDEVVCAFFSEWLAAPALAMGLYKNNPNAVANTLPVSGAHIYAQRYVEESGLQWALFYSDSNDIYLTFALRMNAQTNDMLRQDTVEPTAIELLSEDGVTQVAVLKSVWDIVEASWKDIVATMTALLGELNHSFRRLLLCGAGLGGAVAKGVALALHRTAKPFGPANPLPACNTEQEQAEGKPTGVVVMTYGAPMIVHGSVPALQRVSSLSRAWQLEGDPIPLLLHEKAFEVYEHFRPQRRLCCARRNYARQGGLLHNTTSTPMAPLATLSYKSILKEEQLTPVLQGMPTGNVSAGALNGFDEALNGAKGYTNALCWRQLTMVMQPGGGAFDKQVSLLRRLSSEIAHELHDTIEDAHQTLASAVNGDYVEEEQPLGDQPVEEDDAFYREEEVQAEERSS